MRRWIAGFGVVALALTLAACARTPASSDVSPMSPEQEKALLHQQAASALARWDAAAGPVTGPLFLPVRDGVSQVGDWEPNLVPEKSDLLRLDIRDPGNLPAAPMPTAPVRWADGVATNLPMIAASEALGVIAKPTKCQATCVQLELAGVDLITGTVLTTRGPATAPVWQFHIKGSAVLVQVPAVTGPKVAWTPPPWDSANRPVGLQFNSAEGSVTGKSLTISFVGAEFGADKPCGVDYPTEAVESPRAVVVIIYERRHSAGDTCDMVGHLRTATVALSSPLGERAVLEVVTGSPIETIRVP